MPGALARPTISESTLSSAPPIPGGAHSRTRGARLGPIREDLRHPRRPMVVCSACLYVDALSLRTLAVKPGGNVALGRSSRSRLSVGSVCGGICRANANCYCERSRLSGQFRRRRLWRPPGKQPSSGAGEPGIQPSGDAAVSGKQPRCGSPPSDIRSRPDAGRGPEPAAPLSAIAARSIDPSTFLMSPSRQIRKTGIPHS
jgi:hypothetical protein